MEVVVSHKSLRAGAAGLLALLMGVPSSAFAAGRCGLAAVQVTVLDQGGSALANLAPADFKVRLKNSSVNVTAVDYGLFPHSTLILFSRAVSMGEPMKGELARLVGESIVAGAPGSVMVGSFGADVSGLVDARGGTGFSNLQAGTDPRNVMYDAVVAGIASMNMHRGDEVVVITDSPDNGSRTSATELQQRFAATGVRFFVAAIPPATGSGTMQQLNDLADYSGGAVLVPLRVDQTTSGVKIQDTQIQPAVDTFSREFTQYNNIYQLETDQDGQEKALPLKVEVERHKLGGGKVIAPAMLAPCTAVGP